MSVATTLFPSAFLASTLGVVTILFLIFLGSPSFAQSQSAPMPDNAHAKSFGVGWTCDRAYRRQGDLCVALVIPANAYATNRTYGAGWECLHGYRKVDGATCIEITVPEGGYLDPSGQSWSCLRTYREADDLCLKIVVPPNAYLTGKSSASAWQCGRGYEVEGETCAPIAVPENAFLNNASYGRPWSCERGYVERKDTCAAVVIPQNAYFDDAGFGPGWKCERGFAVSNTDCTPIDLPENAHLDRTGNRWECHRNFQRSQGRCVLND